MAFIEFDKVNLSYPIRENHGLTLKEFVLRVFTNRHKTGFRHIHALKDVSFSIRDGERVGIIGYNGAGKSTLLRTIAGIYPTASGSRTLEGSICSLFDINIGFETDATGYDNIYYRSFLQGETPATLKEKVATIAEFSELGDFLKIPLRCYSTGMVTRLAFSIATSSDPEILLIDEVFSTGDIVFQRKAEQRMKDFLHRANIVVVVGHNLSFMEDFCQRVIWMHKGSIHKQGPAKEIIAEYVTFSEARKRRIGGETPDLLVA